jgi:hypothetical protein
VEIKGKTTKEIAAHIENLNGIRAIVCKHPAIVTASTSQPITGTDKGYYIKASAFHPNDLAAAATPLALSETQAMIDKVEWEPWAKVDFTWPNVG